MMAASTALARFPDPVVHPPSTDELGDEIAELAANIHAATYRLLVLLRKFDVRYGWDGAWRSCAHWLSWRTGIGLGAAREWVRVGKALAHLPQTSDAMRRGELSFSKVRAITRAATAENEETFLNIARHGTTYHLEKLVRAWRRCNREEDIERANSCHMRRSLQAYFDDDGMLVVRGRLDAEVGAVVLRALEAAEEEAYRKRRSEGDEGDSVLDDASSGQRADALGLLAEAALGEGLEGRHRTADHYQVVVHVESEEAASAAASAQPDFDSGFLDDGEHVSAETSRRIACDAGVVVMVEGRNGEALDVGRKTRSILPAMGSRSSRPWLPVPGLRIAVLRRTPRDPLGGWRGDEAVELGAALQVAPSSGPRGGIHRRARAGRDGQVSPAARTSVPGLPAAVGAAVGSGRGAAGAKRGGRARARSEHGCSVERRSIPRPGLAGLAVLRTGACAARGWRGFLGTFQLKRRAVSAKVVGA
ncbi:MAG TPA: DUF222 domain-containing protein [Thermoanaerobaculia bacterium]|nr:DUF222 domain-containing protein [Thermoanaerobaculia bacterium]